MASFASGSGGACCFLSNPAATKILGANPSTARGSGVHLNAHPKENKIIYCSGKYVIVRSLDDPSDCFVYRGHSHPTTVAKFSPNGFWVASADLSGKVRIWSWDNPEHILKVEVPVFSGPVRDIDWDFESKKVVAVGEGAGLMAKVFVWDTGNSTGDIVGHMKPVLSCAYKPTRPFKILTASEDMKTIQHTGPPFKLDHSNVCHTNFVNCVRYSPDGQFAISVGSDKKIQLYDGTTGVPSGEIVDAHAGSIYSVSFSPDSSQFITSSADKTVKLWDRASLVCLQTFTFSEDPQIADMQVSVIWTPRAMVSLSLNGNINILDISSPSRPAHIIEANQVAITCCHWDPTVGSIYTGSFDGVVVATPLASKVSRKFLGTDKKNVCGAVHTGNVVAISTSNGSVVSVGFDDSLRFARDGAYYAAVSLTGQPTALACSDSSDLLVVTTKAEIALYRGQTKVGSLGALSYTTTCVALSKCGSEIAVGGDDMKTHVYSIADFVLTPVTDIETRSAVTAIAYDPNGELLAIGDSGRQVEVYERGSWAARVKGRWVFHTSRVTCLSWSPDGQRLASGSLDESIIVWNLQQVTTKNQMQFAHSSGVSGITWASDQVLLSVGSDHSIVQWTVAP